MLLCSITEFVNNKDAYDSILEMNHHMEKKNIQTTAICILYTPIILTVAWQHFGCNVVSKHMLNEIKGAIISTWTNNIILKYLNSYR